MEIQSLEIGVQISHGIYSGFSQGVVVLCIELRPHLDEVCRDLANRKQPPRVVTKSGIAKRSRSRFEQHTD